MKTLFNTLLAFIIIWASVFWLNKLGVITLNSTGTLDNWTVLTWDLEVDNWETINDMPIDETGETNIEDNLTWDTTNNPNNNTVYLTIPYADTAEIGTFTKLWSINSTTNLYSYKVKLWGNIWGVENKRIEYSKNNQLTWTVAYIDKDWKELLKETKLSANEVVYVSLQTEQTEKISNNGIWNTTATVSSNDWTENSNKNTSKVENCKKYEAFFSCVLNKISWVDPEVMKNNLNAFMNAISGLTPTEQDAKCSKLIYEIKSKSASTTNNICLDTLQ